MIQRVAMCRCEKIPEKEFDAHPELHEGWEVLCRKDGFVYIGYRPDETLRPTKEK